MRVYLAISYESNAARVRQLLAFGKSWIDNCPLVNQKGYKKYCIESGSSGYMMELIFYPCVNADRDEVRVTPLACSAY